MLILEGICKGVVHTDASTDKNTGEMREAADRVQIEVENVMPNGDVKFEIYTLKTEQPEQLRKLAGKVVRLPVGMMVQNGKASLYGLKSPPLAQPVAKPAHP